MNATYSNLIKTLSPSAHRLVSPETGVIVAFDPNNTNARGAFYITLIESYKSKRVRNSYVSNIDKVNDVFVQYVEQEQRMNAIRATRRGYQKAEKEKFLATLKVGSILHGSWGYEQTNCEYFVIREINGAKVKIQEIGHTTVEDTSWASANVLPDINHPRGEILERLVVSNYIKPHDSCSLGPWSGKPNHSSWYA